MSTTIISTGDGPRTTVSTLLGNPMLIPARIIALLANAFISETLLRNAGSNSNGLVAYEQAAPIYLDGEPQPLVEFEEIPVAAGQMGLPRIAYALKKGLGVRISREMRDENKIDQVNRQITQLVNTMIRAEERALRQLFTNPAIPTIAAGAAWDSANGRPRRDIANAMEVIASAQPAAAVDDDDAFFDYVADSIVLPGSITPVLMDNDNFLSVYKDSDVRANEDIRYTGKLPRDIMGMLALQSRSFTQDRVLVLERGTVGFYSDTRPLEATGVYPEGNGPNGGSTESWRSDTTRKRAVGLDEPQAACWVTGVKTA